MLNPIIPPLNPGDQNEAVANLHHALFFLFDTGRFDTASLQKNLAELKEEINGNTHLYSRATIILINFFQQLLGLPLSSEVDPPTADRLNALLQEHGGFDQPSYKVCGFIYDSTSSPYPGVIVQAYDKDLRNKELLGEVMTNEKGYYEIHYSDSQFRRAEKKMADLEVQVLDPIRTMLVSSETFFNAPTEQTINLVIGGGELQGFSEYEELLNEISPLLDGLSFLDLKENEDHQDFTFLSQETGQPYNRIEFLSLAFEFAQQTDLLPEVFYGLFRQNLPKDLVGLLEQHPQLLLLALQNSVNQNIIPAYLSKGLEQIVEQLQQLRVHFALEPSKNFNATLGDLLLIADYEEPIKEKFATIYLQHEGTTDDFWTSLSKHQEFQQQGQVEQLKFTFKLANLTKSNLPLIRSLQQRWNGDERESLRSLAKLDTSEWVSLIDNATAGIEDAFPPDIIGNNKEEKIDNFAKAIERSLESVFPTTVIAKKIQKEEVPHREDLLQFFSNNPSFELSVIPVTHFIKESSENIFTGVKDPQSTIVQLKRMERIHKFTQGFDEMRPLLNDNINSAQEIVLGGRESFVAKYKENLGGEWRTEEIYNNALHLASRSFATYATFATSWNNIGTRVTPHLTDFFKNETELEEVLPDWKSLFGALELCQCEHCKSMLSPAAYLVDILHFLQNGEKNSKGLTPLSVLLKRRGDLQDIELTCQNTNVTLPYIDLVNEVLMNAVHPVLSAGLWQTRGTAEERLAFPDPQKVIPKAFDLLATQVYPWNLPFDLPLEQVRIYLGHIGVSRAHIMETYLGRTGLVEDTKGNPADVAIAAEYLSLSTTEYQIITGTIGKTNAELWGYGVSETAKWISEIQKLSNFLHRSGLTYLEALELVDLRFLDSGGEIDITPVAACNPDEMRISAKSTESLATFLEQIPRFVRLWRRIGWSMMDLDRVLICLKASQTSDIIIQELSQIKKLQRQFDLPLEEMLIWWSPFDNYSYITPGIPKTVSLYEKLFMSLSIINPLDPSLDFSSLPSEELLTTHAPAILGALRIEISDLSLLTDSLKAKETLGLEKPELEDNTLKLENLSHLFRVVSFSRALQLSVVDFLSAKALTGIDPFKNIESTIQFEKSIRQINSSPFSIEELDYLVRGAKRPSSAIIPLQSQSDQILDLIYTGLLKLDPTGDIIRQLLQEVIPANEVDTAIILISDTSIQTPEIQDERRTFIEKHFPTILKTEEGKVKLIPTEANLDQALQDRTSRFAYVMVKLLGFVEKGVSAPLIDQLTEPLYNALKLDFKIFQELLVLIKPISDPSNNMLAVLLNTVLAKHLPLTDSTANAIFYRNYIQLHKLVKIMHGYNMSPKELIWILQRGSGLGWLDLSAPTQFMKWQRLDNLFRLFEWKNKLREENQAGEIPLFKIFDAADSGMVTEVELRNTLASLIDQELKDDTVEGLFHIIDLKDPLSYRDERHFLLLAEGFKISNQTGLSPKLLRMVSTDPVSDIVSWEVMQSIRASYFNGLPLSTIRPLSDLLRERLRSAFVSYLIFRDKFTNSNNLFAYYLIDVEMDACQLTSRIKQAISTVQLFVQRALMGLERDVVISHYLAKRWRWMKNYRVWEANRKVFLYPENWIESDLRDDKTPFFKDFENDLLQDEVTTDSVEKAFTNYLFQLDEVVLLDICAMFDERKRISNIIHVFGRTRSIPHKYFYRRLEDNIWTAWEKVDLDIEGNHLLPIVYEGRLRLFWPIFRDGSNAVNGKEVNPSRKYWEIVMASSTYDNGSWSAKAESQEFLNLWYLDYDSIEAKDDKRDVFITNKKEVNFKIIPQKEKLVIYCYVNQFRTYRILQGDQWVNPKEGGKGNIWQWVSAGWFTMEGCHSKITVTAHGAIASILPPPRTHYEYQKIVEGPEIIPDGTQLIHLPDSLLLPAHILSKTPGKFQLLTPHQDVNFNSINPFFFQDATRAFFVSTDEKVGGGVSGEINNPTNYLSYAFQNFYHPYSCSFIKQSNLNGIVGLLDPSPNDKNKEVQLLSRQRINDRLHFEEGFFKRFYDPSSVTEPFPEEKIDFDLDGSYSQYNWELFFHIPFLIANQLNQNQKFEEAQRWFHLIFDPTDTSSLPTPQRYWKIWPFFKNMDSKHTIARLVELLHVSPSGDPSLIKIKEKFESQVKAWMANPFNPHLIARMRINAYQKTVVMKYIDNLIDWGDQLFRRETLEAINEAIQLYVMAAEILGNRPKELPARNGVVKKTYRELASSTLDILSNNVVELEGFMPPAKSTSDAAKDKSPSDSPKQAEELENLLTMGLSLYFCVPQNDLLLRYWDTVADRLFKIRNCMDIEGNVRQLPLFEPPIDPALLVRATAAGLDLSTVLNEMNAPLPNYRFMTMMQKANEFCHDVKALGASLLSALEKKDAEILSTLRSQQEIEMLKMVSLIKQQQIDDAKHSLEALQETRHMVNHRLEYYSSRKLINDGEQVHLALSGISVLQLGKAAWLQSTAAAMHPIPDTSVGFCSAVKNGGSHIGSSLEAASRALSAWASVSNTIGSISATMGSFQRRMDDWKLQADLATKELAQIDKQILGAQIRLSIVQQELRNHDLQIKQAKEIDSHLRRKFTNRELYNWMVSQISALYFQSYRMAYDLAKRAERCYTFELGKQKDRGDIPFIQPLYWDSLKKGLLAGERLQHDIKRMEVAYLDQNKREYEITKHISLALLDPIALIKLRQTGECFLSIPEVLFDIDYSGHYMRRIKSIALTIPCISGPYTSINCTLTLLKNSIRLNTHMLKDQYIGVENDERFNEVIGAVQSIVTSSAQNDSGLFQTDVRDERYLPFEGRGVISDWRIELPKELRQFNYDSISDVIISINYTSRSGGAVFRKKVSEYIQKVAKDSLPMDILFSLKHDFPTEFHQLLHPSDGLQQASFEVTKNHLPYWLSVQNVTVVKPALVFIKPKANVLKVIDLKIDENEVAFDKTTLGNLKQGKVPIEDSLIKKHTIASPSNSLHPDEIDDVLILVNIKVKYGST